MFVETTCHCKEVVSRVLVMITFFVKDSIGARSMQDSCQIRRITMKEVTPLKTIRILFNKKTGRSHIVRRLSDGRLPITTYIFNPISCRPDKLNLSIWETSLLIIAKAYKEGLLGEDEPIYPKETFKLNMSSNCIWTWDSRNNTSCVKTFEYDSSDFKFCPYCRKKIKYAEDI